MSHARSDEDCNLDSRCVSVHTARTMTTDLAHTSISQIVVVISIVPR